MAGLLKTDPESGSARIKRYLDDRGQPKGDALLTFLKPESVALAVTLRDGYEIVPGATLSVSAAKFEMRGEPKLQPAKRLGREAVQMRKLAEEIIEAQEHEIAELETWLKANDTD